MRNVHSNVLGSNPLAFFVGFDLSGLCRGLGLVLFLLLGVPLGLLLVALLRAPSLATFLDGVPFVTVLFLLIDFLNNFFFFGVFL